MKSKVANKADESRKIPEEGNYYNLRLNNAGSGNKLNVVPVSRFFHM